jgi:hypothetical protein
MIISAISCHARCPRLSALLGGLGQALTCTPAVVIAIDGKTSRRSYQTKGSKEAVHMVSLRSEATHRAGPGQGEREVERAVAIPALLDIMSIEGRRGDNRAMSCQRDIASKIIGKKADDYIIALKVNQSTLRDDVAVFVDGQKPLNTGIPVRTKPSMPITAVSRP